MRGGEIWRAEAVFTTRAHYDHSVRRTTARLTYRPFENKTILDLHGGFGVLLQAVQRDGVKGSAHLRQTAYNSHAHLEATAE